MSNENIVKRKSNFIRNLVFVVLTLVVIIALIYFITFQIQKQRKSSANTWSISDAWKKYDYQSVYELTQDILDESPFNNFSLTYHGFACFYLAVSSLNSEVGQAYLDDAINSIRIAFLSAKKSSIPQLEYMLGKCYFYKNTISTYYYSELAEKYLLKSEEHGYKADDISEYLGLCYASLGQPEKSIQYFAESLSIRESDSLLLSIAEQYYNMKQYSAAKGYLFQIISKSRNDDLVLKSMNLLGLIYIEEDNLDAAQQEFESILKKNKNSGDAYYGLGVIYEKKGELVKARAEWRKTLRVQVSHQGALKKMADYN